ncbi:hypothetical protein FHG55_16295 [Pseudomonas jessenii]|uniref:Uncharacterized protein n=1 Tax=Pseudomonas jessenii TaxID=77298 RepID=A0A5C4KXM9_PSEJE|nr:hypothetical protein FHG55_16295 [Pseudomonas jessenii]
MQIPKNHCGSGLAREIGVPVKQLLTDTPLSRASPLPHLLWRFAENQLSTSARRSRPCNARSAVSSCMQRSRNRYM